MNTDRKNTLKFAAAGACAGVVNGFFGGGGGMILVPLLSVWCGLEDRKSFATCVCIILPLCMVSAAVYIFRSGIDLVSAAPYLAGGLAGGIIAGKIFRNIPVIWLRRTLALFIIYGGVRSLFWA